MKGEYFLAVRPKGEILVRPAIAGPIGPKKELGVLGCS